MEELEEILICADVGVNAAEEIIDELRDAIKDGRLKEKEQVISTLQEILARMRKEATLPILTKPAHARKLSAQALAQFETEGRCTDLYDLCFRDIPRPGREWNTNPVRLEG